MTDWENKLDHFLEQQEQSEEARKQKVELHKAAMVERTEKREQAALFVRQTVEPAFGELAAKLKERGKKILIEGGDLSRALRVSSKDGNTEFIYALNIDSRTGITMARVCIKYKGAPEEGDKTILKNYKEPDISNITETDIVEDFVEKYTRVMSHGKAL
jgi:hypothetical protein